MLKSNYLVLLLFITTMFFSNSIQTKGEPLSIKEYPSIADTYVDIWYPFSNFGGAKVLKMEYSSSVPTGVYSFVAFEVNNTFQDSNVTDIYLELTVWKMPDDNHSVRLLIYETKFFGERNLTYENNPNLRYMQLVGFYYISELNSMKIKLSNVGAFLTDGKLAFMLATDTDNPYPIRFFSRENSDNKPKLIITNGYNESFATHKDLNESDQFISSSYMFPIVFLVGIILTIIKKRN